MFCDTTLAARIERGEAELMASTTRGGFAIPIAGCFATFAGEKSPFNKFAGPGFRGVPTAAALDEVERAFAARDASV